MCVFRFFRFPISDFFCVFFLIFFLNFPIIFTTVFSDVFFWFFSDFSRFLLCFFLFVPIFSYFLRFFLYFFLIVEALVVCEQRQVFKKNKVFTTRTSSGVHKTTATTKDVTRLCTYTWFLFFCYHQQA